MRAATIDIGTNTVLLLVAERSTDAELRPLAEHATITRLGEGVDRTRRLSAGAVARTRECLEEYARIVRRWNVDHVAVVGTSAMRDAGGGEDLREQARSLLGVEVRVLSGEEEARLTFRGALSGLGIGAEEDVAVFDVGGGSTEVVVGRLRDREPRISFGASYDVGSVRLTERHVAHDPPTNEEMEALALGAKEALKGAPRSPSGSVPVGVAGTMTTLAAVSLGLTSYDGSRVHGLEIPVSELRRVVHMLASLPLEARKRLPGMEPKRADVIVAGGIVALAAIESLIGSPASDATVDKVRVSDRGVRWGLAEELLGSRLAPS